MEPTQSIKPYIDIKRFNDDVTFEKFHKLASAPNQAAFLYFSDKFKP